MSEAAVGWTCIASGRRVPARPQTGLWTRVVDEVAGPTVLRIVATGSWFYSDTNECGPDGDSVSLLASDRTICSDAPVGALVGRIGGSTAEIGANVFAAGSFVERVVDKDTSGALFLTMNDEPNGLTNNQGGLVVEIWTKAPPATAPAPTQTR